MTEPAGEAFLRGARFEFRRLKGLAEAAIAQVPGEAGLHRRASPDANSIAVLMRHLAGNLRSRWTDFLTSDGEKPDRDREGEFEPRPDLAREDLVREWDAAFALALAQLDGLSGPDLDRAVRIRSEPFTVMEAIQRQVVHLAYHSGQIVQLAREEADRWRSLSIPRGAAPGVAPRYKA